MSATSGGDLYGKVQVGDIVRLDNGQRAIVIGLFDHKTKIAFVPFVDGACVKEVIYSANQPAEEPEAKP